jgi:putative PEP-CTERM system TPR-repeat lipoprotein
MFRRTREWTILLVVGMVVAAGCSRSPEVRKSRHLERGDSYAARQQYREAVLEYRNVLRIDPTNERAVRQLGVVHYELGELAQAFRYLLKAEELAPDALDIRVKLGAIYFLGDKPQEARRHLVFVLEKEPKHLDALVLLAGMATTPETVDAAIRRLEMAQADLGSRGKLHLALGVLYLRKHDVARAEGAFQEAVAREPTLAEARLALGELYLGKGDITQAERSFRAAVDIAPVGSVARVRLADFYLLTQKPHEAKRILSEMTREVPAYLPAWRRLAEVWFQERNYDESLKALQTLLQKNPSDLEGHLLQGRVRLAKGEPTEAIQEFQQVLKLDPRNAIARYQLGLAQLRAGSFQQAKVELREAISAAPNLTEAVLLLAELNIQAGTVQPAIEDLQSFLARHPGVVPAHSLLGLAYLAKREPARATEAFRKLQALDPQDPRGFYLVGIGLRVQGKTAEARKEFEAALSRAPGYVEPLGQLAGMAFAEKQPDAALSRVTKEIALSPKSGGLQYLLGMVHLARGEAALAERAFLSATDLEPTRIDAYVRLGDLYQTSARYDEALAKLNEALKVNPAALPPLMLMGVVYERKGDAARAQQVYERVLTLNPRMAGAANNLAWLYSEHGGDKDKALQLAQTAKEMAPEDPHVSDTLGWILYKRGVYQRAVGLLRESATKLPDRPVIQYHLGLASLKVGDKDSARAALSAAVNSSASFPEKGEAKKTLAELR